jgi:hypothetical protein
MNRRDFIRRLAFAPAALAWAAHVAGKDAGPERLRLPPLLPPVRAPSAKAIPSAQGR